MAYSQTTQPSTKYTGAINSNLLVAVDNRLTGRWSAVSERMTQ